MSSMDVNAIREYLAGKGASYSDEAIENATTAERELQQRACRVDPLSAALFEALCRRVHRNLAMRAIPLGVQETGDGVGVRLGSNDPEVRRLEAPYRKTAVG